jgi:hypothetical protein
MKEMLVETKAYFFGSNLMSHTKQNEKHALTLGQMVTPPEQVHFVQLKKSQGEVFVANDTLFRPVIF